MSASKFRTALAEFLSDPKGVKLEAYRNSLVPHADPEKVKMWQQWHDMREELVTTAGKRGTQIGRYDDADKIELALMAF